MRFMNHYEVDEAQERWQDHPVLGPATQTLANLMHWTNRNSDGWAYWPKPTRAAAKLMELIQGDGTYHFMVGERADATPAKLKAALTPIKAFRTRQKGADFEIVEELPPPPAADTGEATMGTRIIAALDDPDTVCESAYRAVHEDITDTITSAAYDGTQDDGEIRETVLGELDNVIEWAQAVRKKIEALPGPIPYAEHALASDPKVYPFVLVDSAGRVRDAYMTAEGAQQDAWQGDTVRPRGEK